MLGSSYTDMILEWKLNQCEAYANKWVIFFFSFHMIEGRNLGMGFPDVSWADGCFFTSLQVWRDSWWSWRAGRYIQVQHWLCFTSLVPWSDYNKDCWQCRLDYDKDCYKFGPCLDHKLVTLQAWPRPISSWVTGGSDRMRNEDNLWSDPGMSAWWDRIPRHAAAPCFHSTDATSWVPLRRASALRCDSSLLRLTARSPLLLLLTLLDQSRECDENVKPFVTRTKVRVRPFQPQHMLEWRNKGGVTSMCERLENLLWLSGCHGLET